MEKTIRTSTGHTMFVESATREELPNDLFAADTYTKFYRVRNFDKTGVIFFYLASGNALAPKQIVAWYGKHYAFWSGYGTTLANAIEGAIADGWKYA